ncbi:MAG: hypothetical protein LAP38_05625 [Acidobacteriia bacterium]|nr:hypothetical protein [Terriglobia bacterium]
MLAFFAIVASGIALKTLNAIKEQARSSKSQLEATQKATELTRQSILLTHRPKLVVRRVVLPDHEIKDGRPRPLEPPLQEGVVPHGSFYVSNIGDTPATVRRYYSQIVLAERLPMISMQSPAEGFQSREENIKVVAGASEPINFPTVGYPALGRMERVNQEDEHIWLLGWIEYTDELVTTRRVDFCRRWEPKLQRFSTESDPDYEHAY